MLKRIKNFIHRLHASRLPPENFYSIDELLQRWQEDRVTRKMLFDWMEAGNLVMGARVRDTNNLSERYQEYDGLMRTSTRNTWFIGGNASPPIHTYYFRADDLTKIVTAAPGRKVRVSGTYPDTRRDPKTGTARGNRDDLYFEESDLVTCLDEVKKIEKDFRIGSKAPSLKRMWRTGRSFGTLVKKGLDVIKEFLPWLPKNRD